MHSGRFLSADPLNFPISNYYFILEFSTNAYYSCKFLIFAKTQPEILKDQILIICCALLKLSSEVFVATAVPSSHELPGQDSRPKTETNSPSSVPDARYQVPVLVQQYQAMATATARTYDRYKVLSGTYVSGKR